MISPPPRRNERLRRSLAGLLLAILLGCAFGQDLESRHYRVPSALVEVASGAFTFAAFGSQVSFLPGLGWTTGWSLPGPDLGDDGVRVTSDVAELLRVPRIEGVRSAIADGGLRIVVDLADLSERAWSSDGPFAPDETAVGPGAVVSWRLPPLAVPLEEGDVTLFQRDGIRLDARDEGAATVLNLQGPDADVRVFPLRDPDRFVIDLRPSSPDADGPPAIDELSEVEPGVRYRRLRADGRHGSSIVHVVELDPDAVELRVVGRSGEGRTVASWSDGGIAAINAGYFDPSTFAAIGLRRIDGTLLSWPSRNRAVVGFADGVTVVTRAGARAQIDVDGVRVADLRLDGREDLAWSAVAGTQLGSARVGVLVLGSDGVVRSNTVGPRTVPDGGSALAYPAEIRPLALVEPGQRVTVGARLIPDELEHMPWAIEAGPLLVDDGVSAFMPEVEGFARGQRILDEPTQQAALGVRPDGTVLFVVAERMIAEDLVPLFLRLGATSALRLDSGSSATLVARGRTLNRLLSRPVESAIVAVPRDESARPR